ncbi:MAG TPA: hypothetical protein DCE58_05135 [Cryomorphaceae bacterium]|nr:hypothetical protein [Cryomorphaceae bacterium]
MKQAAVILLLVTGLISACQWGGSAQPQNPSEKPEDLLPEKTFVKLLYEMNLLEGARTGNTLLGDSIPLNAYYETLYADFGVTAEQVQRNFTYYHSDAEKMATYYQWIIDSLRVDVQALSAPIQSEERDESDE